LPPKAHSVYISWAACALGKKTEVHYKETGGPRAMKCAALAAKQNPFYRGKLPA